MCSASPSGPTAKGLPQVCLAWTSLCQCTLVLHACVLMQALPAQVMRAKAQGSATAGLTAEPSAASPPSDRATAQANGVAGTPLEGLQAAAAQQTPKALPDEPDGELQCTECSVI